MKYLLIVLTFSWPFFAIGQEVVRIPISGHIVVTTEDKEGVTVFNTASNTGTLTDKKGDFTALVALNDVLEFSALQFKDFQVTITTDIMTSKKLTVILVEEVNKLDEVIILPFDLTGNLNADLENVRTYNVSLDDIYFGLDHIEDFDFSSDFKSKADNLAFDESNPRVENMLNIVNLAGFIVSQVVDINDKGAGNNAEMVIEKTPFKAAMDTYSVNYIHRNFNIPLHRVDAFIDYVEAQGIDDKLLENDKEIQFLERITQLSKSFLNIPREKE